MKERITCPERGTICYLEYQESPETSRILGATGCSLMDGEVTCDQECVRLLNIKRDSEDSTKRDSEDSTPEEFGVKTPNSESPAFAGLEKTPSSPEKP